MSNLNVLKMRTVLLTGLSFVLTGAVIGNAYYQKKQFYPSVVYITKSNPSMAMLYIQAFVFVILMGKLMRKVFFGQLRPAEMEHLIERSWYAVTETCLAFTVFRDDFSPRFVALFTILLFLKCFHWLAEDRIDYMERSPVISLLFHLRAITLITLLGILDLYFINHAYYSTLLKGASVQLVFGFEYAILLTVLFMAFVKYILHTLDAQNENPWENKAVYLLYTELVLGFIKVVLYMAFMMIMIKVHTFPLFAIRPMYLSLRGFKKALHDVIMSRRAIRNMNTLYPDATAEELQAGDHTCIICREDMIEFSKKLPCNHIFHTSCLRSWFQRQQTCPTCRMDVLQAPRPQQVPQTPPPQQQQPQQPQMPQNLFQGFAGMPPIPGWPPQQQPVQQPGTSGASTTGTPATPTTPNTPGSGTSTVSATGTHPSTTPPTSVPNMPPFMPPMFPFFMPYSGQGMPLPPTRPEGLTDEELKVMEGQERQNVEARIQWLRDIQCLLDGAMILIQQYNTVASQSSIPNINLSGTPSNNTPTDTNKASSSREKSKESSPVVNNDRDLDKDLSDLEGATGYTPPTEEMIPSWEDPSQEEHEDEQHEVRRRRLEKFSQPSPNNHIVKEKAATD
ncbi:E3 ubiquitin-protein ligase synoviolin B-like [Mytilus californianus]|uniref:E3 ubiquitin-protein ligase synoviolin B-like n=1 Tax=Mytilus californianus TaxID=6549 RepID=UPI002246C4DD|nr:E3 ubiquitin-protein ligase synoviolin B-like [Mytilus californianus]